MSTVVVSSVVDYTHSGATVELECAVDSLDGADRTVDRTIPVTIRFYAPDIFRFELRANPENPRTDSPLKYDLDAIEAPVDLSVMETSTELIVETRDVTLRIGTEDWKFEVRDSNGRLLTREQRADVNAKDVRRTAPLRFVEEQVNRWPFRVSETGTAFALQPDERLYGLGEKFTEFEKRGQRITSWITQPNGTETEHAYKNVPFYLSTRGYGLLVDTVHKTTFDFGASSAVATDIRVEADAFRFFFFAGPDLKGVLQRYTALTGRPHRPRRWTFGVWMSRLAYESRTELEAVARKLRDREIPCDVLHLDPFWMDIETMCDLEWDEDAFPDPEGMITTLNEDGFKLSLWEFPYVQVDSPLFETFAERGYFVEDGSGNPYVLDRMSADNRGAIVDFTDSDARSWWAERHRELAELGVDIFKLDFGEYLPRDAVLSNGRTGAAMRNQYPRLYQETVRDALESAGDDRPTLWVRAAWTGDQRFPIHWGGDPNTTFESMAASVRGGLSLALSGFPFWATDIGGFRGEPSTELYVRWAQWSLLGTSHARFHGTTPREPWHFGEDAEAIVREYIRERYRLLPYLYSYAERASRTGLPLMRPLVLEYQDDPAARGADTQHLLGEELLVAPVLNPEGHRDVYLPEGEWIDYWTGERYEGEQTLHRDVSLETLPLYLAAGSIIPYREPSQYIESESESEPETERLLLRVEFRSPRASDGKREAAFDYYVPETGELAPISAVHDPADETVTVETPQGCMVESIRMRRFNSTPSTVVVDGDAYEQVDREPESGEWRHDPGDGELRLTVHDGDGQEQ